MTTCQLGWHNINNATLHYICECTPKSRKITPTYHGLKTQTPNENPKTDGLKTRCALGDY
jgi:hypothetical protein